MALAHEFHVNPIAFSRPSREEVSLADGISANGGALTWIGIT